VRRGEMTKEKWRERHEERSGKLGGEEKERKMKNEKGEGRKSKENLGRKKKMGKQRNGRSGKSENVLGEGEGVRGEWQRQAGMSKTTMTRRWGKSENVLGEGEGVRGERQRQAGMSKTTMTSSSTRFSYPFLFPSRCILVSPPWPPRPPLRVYSFPRAYPACTTAVL
jgi:hypothetical protein